MKNLFYWTSYLKPRISKNNRIATAKKVAIETLRLDAALVSSLLLSSLLSNAKSSAKIAERGASTSVAMPTAKTV